MDLLSLPKNEDIEISSTISECGSYSFEHEDLDADNVSVFSTAIDDNDATMPTTGTRGDDGQVVLKCPLCLCEWNGWWCDECTAQDLEADFPNWTSGNDAVDEFIRATQLEAGRRDEGQPHPYCRWYPFERFRELEPIGEGSIGIVARASIVLYTDVTGIKRARRERRVVGTVALKRIYNSWNIDDNFVAELQPHMLPEFASALVRIYGFTQDPRTGDYMVMEAYANRGSLHQCLCNRQNPPLTWRERLDMLHMIATHVATLHAQNRAHGNLHSGNVLVHEDSGDDLSSKRIVLIGDLVTRRPPVRAVVTAGGDGDEREPTAARENNAEQEEEEEEVYGVIPYLPPEAAVVQPTAAFDVYALAMIMWELLGNGQRPLGDCAHDADLVRGVSRGVRPKVPAHAPAWYVDLIKRAWAADPLERPLADEIRESVSQMMDTLDANDEQWATEGLPIKSAEHPGAVYSSRPLRVIMDAAFRVQ